METRNSAVRPIIRNTFPVSSLAGAARLHSSRVAPPRPAVLEFPTVGGIAERLLALLTSSAVRKGSLKKMQFQRCRADLLRAIDRCVRADKSVQLTLMAFPFKVPNPAKVGPRRMPDLAELAALAQLQQLHRKIKSIYPPGLEIHIIHDGAYIAAVFGVTLDEVYGYERYFSRMVDALDGERFLHMHDIQTLAHLAGYTNVGQQAGRLRRAIPDWPRGSQEWRERFSKTLGMMNLRGFPADEVSRLLDHAGSGRLPAGYDDLERQVRMASLRYYLRDALLDAIDPLPACFPDAIHVTTQCRPGRLAIWMVGRGCSLLPWEGVGVIDGAGKWEVALAREVLGNPKYREVFLDGEDTPFCYEEQER
jgi:Pyoverdine/dityrosine biosynthesis protein